MPNVDRKQLLVRIDPKDKAILDALSTRTGESGPRLLHRAICKLKQDLFFDELNEGYAALRRDPEAWSKYQEDNALFDHAVADGLQELS
jgi:hypothetical protein